VRKTPLARNDFHRELHEPVPEFSISLGKVYDDD
jgi:hypothetical protein